MYASKSTPEYKRLSREFVDVLYSRSEGCEYRWRKKKLDTGYRGL